MVHSIQTQQTKTKAKKTKVEKKAKKKATKLAQGNKKKQDEQAGKERSKGMLNWIKEKASDCFKDVTGLVTTLTTKKIAPLELKDGGTIPYHKLLAVAGFTTQGTVANDPKIVIPLEQVHYIFPVEYVSTCKICALACARVYTVCPVKVPYIHISFRSTGLICMSQCTQPYWMYIFNK